MGSLPLASLDSSTIAQHFSFSSLTTISLSFAFLNSNFGDFLLLILSIQNYFVIFGAVNFNSKIDGIWSKWCISKRFLNIRLRIDKKFCLKPNPKNAQTYEMQSVNYSYRVIRNKMRRSIY